MAAGTTFQSEPGWPNAPTNCVNTLQLATTMIAAIRHRAPAAHSSRKPSRKTNAGSVSESIRSPYDQPPNQVRSKQ